MFSHAYSLETRSAYPVRRLFDDRMYIKNILGRDDGRSVLRTAINVTIRLRRWTAWAGDVI